MSRFKIFAFLLFALVSQLPNEVRAQNIAAPEPEGVKVVVLDPGHGGKFSGATYGGVVEKELTLAIALKLGALIEEGMPGVKVVYTRTTDKHLGEKLIDDLQARADIANRNRGNLFLSIHVNASRSRTVRGVETLIMGETPKEQQYNEAALISSNREEYIELVDDAEGTAAMKRAYIQNMQFTYGQYSMALARCVQESYKRRGRHLRDIKPQLLRVLYATNMPGALTEVGFMSNAQELAYMKSEKGQREIARSLYDGVKSYADRLEAIRRAEAGAEDAGAADADTTASEPAVVPAAAAAAGIGTEAAAPAEAAPETFYAVQLLAGAKPVSARSTEFKTYKGQAKEFKGTGKLPYKYCVGKFATAAAAQRKLKEVRKQFPDAFVVCCCGDEIVNKR